MTVIQLQRISDDKIRLSGDLTRDSVNQLLDQAQNCFQSPAMTIDCADISQTDSAGVALLVEWSRQAKARHCKLTFIDMPAQMQSLIFVSHLDKYFDLG